jgi:hypothetical protein
MVFKAPLQLRRKNESTFAGVLALFPVRAGKFVDLDLPRRAAAVASQIR